MVQIKRILCPVDFSEFSQHALDQAIAVARIYSASITVLNVFPIAIPADPFAGLKDFQPFTLQAADKERLIARIREFVATEAGARYPVDCVLREGVDIHAEILDAARQIRPDLIVMGTHGRSGFQHLVLGSVAEKVLRKASCPVLTVPRKAPDVVPSGPVLYRRILCGVDFSDCSLAALEYAQSLAAGSKASLDIVSVVQLVPMWESSPAGMMYYPVGLSDELQAEARRRLDTLVAASASMGLSAEGIVTVGSPHQEIIRLAADRRNELIVLGVQGRGAVDRMLFGSTTNHVVRRAACPVLTIRTEPLQSRAQEASK